MGEVLVIYDGFYLFLCEVFVVYAFFGGEGFLYVLGVVFLDDVVFHAVSEYVVEDGFDDCLCGAGFAF